MAGWGDFAVAAVQLAGTAYASKQAKDAAKNAGAQEAAGDEKSAALSKYIYDDQRALSMPGYNRGEWAANTLAQYLGMPSGAQSSATSSSSAAPDHWYTMQNGVPVADAQMYGSDPRYKSAWDQATLEHRNSHDGGGYTAASDTGAIGSRLAALYGQQPQAQQGTQGQTMDRSALYDMFRKQPGYEFGLQEQNRGIEASAAARGGLNSGATLKALAKYSQNYADQQGWQPYLNQMQSMAGLAQTAAGQIGSAGQNYASQAGNAFQNAGQARAQSTYGAANANMWGIQQAGSQLNDWYGGYKQRNGGGY